jgi:hypothetical protein
VAGRRVRHTVAVLMGSALLSGCWLQPGFDSSQTRWNPLENRLTAANVAHLAELWSVDISAPGLYEPLVQAGRVYVGRPASQSTGGGVRALDAATGETVWDRTTTPAGGVHAHPPTFVEGELWSSWWQGFGEPGRCDFGTVRLDRDGNVVGSDDAGFPVSRPVQSGPYVLQVLRPDCPPDIYFWIGATLRVRDSRTLETLWAADADVGTISGGQILAGSGFFPLAGCGAPTCTPTAHGEFPVTVDQPYVAGPDTDVYGVRGPLVSRTTPRSSRSRAPPARRRGGPRRTPARRPSPSTTTTCTSRRERSSPGMPRPCSPSTSTGAAGRAAGRSGPGR